MVPHVFMFAALLAYDLDPTLGYVDIVVPDVRSRNDYSIVRKCTFCCLFSASKSSHKLLISLRRLW
jgi:hypothetical protein